MYRTIAFLAALCLALPVLAGDRFVFGTNWKAEAEHGGFYQALAEGRYADYGLEVTIREGGPQVNHNQLLARRGAGRGDDLQQRRGAQLPEERHPHGHRGRVLPEGPAGAARPSRVADPLRSPR